MKGPHPMPAWLRKKVVAFFLGMAILCVAVNGAVLMFAPKTGTAVTVCIYFFGALTGANIIAAIYFNHAPQITDEEWDQHVERSRFEQGRKTLNRKR